MSISPQTIAPLSQQLVDPNTGFPTKPLADFLFHLANAAGYDDEALKTEIESILGTQAEHGGLITKLLDSLQDEANARKVALQVLQQQIVDDTLALTRKIDFYKSRLNDINASFTRIQQSQVSDREASAKMKQTFSAENKSRKAEIKTEMLARIDADSAIASDITQLQTDLGSVDGAVSGNSSAISALDARVTTNEGDISVNASDIMSLQSDLTDIGGDVSGNSSAISTLQTNVSQNISDIASVQADASQALADASSAQSTADAATNAAQLAQDTADGKITAFYQATAPSGGVESGDLWFDTNDGNKCYRWTGSTWSAIDDARIADAVSAAATAQSTADGKVVTFVQSSQPTADAVGDLWFDSDDSYKAYRWNGSSWASMVDRRVSTALSDASQALADASSAQSTADAATNAAQLAQDMADGKITAFYQATAPSGGVESGDLWFDTNDGNKCYRWTGSTWSAIDDARIADAVSAAATAQSTADGKVVTFVQSSQPTADAVGDLWFDSDDSYKAYRWNGSSWASMVDRRVSTALSDASQALADASSAQSTADAATNAAQLAQDTADGKITAFYQATAPSGGVESGDLWFDTNDGNKCYRWTGSTWSAIDDARIADAVSAAATAQSTADGKVVTFVQSSQPTADAVGDLWFDSDDSYKAYRWNGSSWASMVDRRVSTALSDASQALADASSAQSTADAATNAAQLAQDTADGKITAFYQATAPSGGVESGDLWFDTNDGNKCYRWTGSTWSAIDDARIADAVSAAATAQSTADGKVVTFVQSSQPTADAVGDLWFDSDDSYKAYRWNGSSWASMVDRRVSTALSDASQALADASSAQSTADAATNAAQLAQDTADGKITAFYQATAPSGGVESGDLWFDTNDGNKCYRWTGSTWSAIDDARIADAVSAAATAQSTADGKVVTFVQSSQPTADAVGDLWFDSDDSYKAYRWNGSSWASMVDRRVSTALSDASQALADASSAQSTADAATNAAQLAQDTADGKITAFYQATAPSGGVESGDLWFDTNDGNKCYRWTGSTWSAIDDARIADAVSAAATAQSTADGKVVTFVQSSQPTADAVGDLWFDSDDSYKMHRWSGSAWVEVADARISANASDITSLQSDLTDIGGDVSGNSSAISTLQTNVSDLDGVVDAMASDVTSLEAGIAAETSNRQNADDALSASITSEQTARVTADNDLAGDVAAVASDVTTLSSTVGSHTTSITTLSQSVDGIEGKWGVAIDSNDYITGIELIGSGQTSAFNINADVFSVNSPGSDDFSFQVADGKVKINGGLIVNGSLDTSQITDNAVTVRASASGTTLAQTATINFVETTDVIALCFGLWGTVSGSFRRLDLYRDTTLLKTWYLPILSIFSGTSITPIHKFSVSPGDHSFKLTASASASECIIVIMGLKK
ncbi:hypothetical protein OO006_04325 [Prosthecochloris sp. SCSIO W1101]|uniref:hypothetical protein n=1 Tax=Prosthecochloris sp. SCSIO W1101 TaxID=2992242 RepID=UPI00223DE5F8|nr:hypothetical protein [Prosthecochloris sp. SCSIO W1101]UZJ42207.1 hypothetical protein OO006_04325 [Prosthecochloris sp. SCSIO W1101]